MFRLEMIRGKLIMLAIVMAAAVLVSTTSVIWILYQTSVTETAERLTESVKSNARLIEAVARYDQKQLGAKASEATLSQIREAHEQFRFGHSGEFTLAKVEEDQIVFLLRNRQAGMEIPDPVLLSKSDRAEPMRRALNGESGWMVGLDYRGVEVMAAFESVKYLNYGIVAKIDMAEINAPYIRAVLTSIVVAIAVGLIAMLFFYRQSRQISEKFEDSSAQFNRLASSAIDTIYRISIPDGKYEYVNPACREMFGVPPEEFYLRPKLIRDMVHPDSLKQFKRDWQQALKGNIPSIREYQIVTPQGEAKWINQRNVLISDEAGNPIAIEAIATDITATREVLQLVLHEKAVAQSYLNIAGVMMVALDREGRVKLFNKKACEVLGWPEVEALGQNWFDSFLPLEQVDEVKGIFAQLMAGEVKQVEFHENNVLSKDGTERIIAWHNSLLRDDSGQIIGIMSSGEDVTELKRVQNELLWKSRVFEDAMTANSIADSFGVIHFANEAFLKVWGYEGMDEVVGRPIPEFLKYEDEAGKVIESLSKRGEWEGEFTALKKDGTTFTAYSLATDIKNSKGELVGYQSSVTDVSERKQAARNLVENEQRFRSLFQSASDYALVLEIQESGPPIIIDANDAAFEKHGYSKEEMIGQPITLLDTKSSAEQVGERLRLIQQGTDVVHFDVEHQCKDGSTFIAESAAKFNETLDGKPVFFSIERDITDRKAAEEALKESEERFSLAMEGSSDGLWDWDLLTNEVNFSARWKSMLGYSEDELENNFETWARLVHPDDIERAKQHIDEYLSGKSTKYELEFKMLHKDGHWVDILARGFAVRDESGEKAVRLVGTHVDLTELKMAERALKLSEEHARGVIENARDAFVSMDDQGLVIDWNPEAERLFGFSREEAVGRDLGATIIPPDVRHLHSEGLAHYLATGEGKVLNTHVEIKGLHKNGDIIPVELSIVPQDIGGTVTFNAFIRDLRDKNRVVDELAGSARKIKQGLLGTIFAITKAVEARDPYTAGHQRRVSVLSRSIAQEMGLDKDHIEGVRMGALIHDIGKIQTPAEILSKPGKLTEFEFQLVQAHPEAGYEILKDVKFPWPIADIAHQHHERIDGSGYPQGLKGEEICIEARIVAVADVVEAMSSHRPYRPGLGIDCALEEIKRGRGGCYDADVVDACLKLFAENRFVFSDA